MNNYEIEKIIEKIYNNKHSNFLDPLVFKQVRNKLKNRLYQVYYPYKDSENVIIYTKEKPSVSLLEITSYEKLTHQEILGSIFALGINKDTFGDIIIDDDRYCLYVLDNIKNFVIDNLLLIGNKKISVKEIPLEEKENYERKYQESEIIVSSLRCDTVIGRIIGTSRDKIKDKIKNKEIIINYTVLTSNSYNFKENDIFSIRRYGKFKFIDVVKTTKKDNYLIKYKKYI